MRHGWILLATGACTWIPAQDVSTTGALPTDPGTVTGGPPSGTPSPPSPTGEVLDIRTFAPGRAGRLNRIEVAGATAGSALAVWISASPSWDAVDGCPGLMVSPPEDLGGCPSDPAPAATTPDGDVVLELCAPSGLAGRTVDYRVVQPDGCLLSPIRSVTFPTRIERTLTDADAVLSPETLGDYAGDSVSAGGDVNGDGLADVLVGAPFYSNGGANPIRGRAYLLYGPVGGDPNLEDADVRLDGQSNDDQAGDGVAIVGDVDGQGGDELVVGAPTYDGTGSRRGRVYLVGAPAPGTVRLDAFPWFTGEVNDDMVGWAVAGAGDIDGDSLADILVGAPQYPVDYADGGPGKAYLFHGDPVPGQAFASPAARLFGRAPGDSAGHSVAGPGDTDGDGLADVLIGAPFDDTRGTDAGAAYLVLGDRAAGEVDLGDADGIFLGEDAFNTAGWAVGAGGDVDGDGLADLVVGADWNSTAGRNAGAAYLVLGRAAPGQAVLSDADARFAGEQPDDRAGGSVGIAGDLDGDGHADVLIGATGVDTAVTNAGAAYVVYGPVWGGVSLADADVRVAGSVVRAFAGYAVSGGGDTDGDGLDDVLIGTVGLGAYLLRGETLSGP